MTREYNAYEVVQATVEAAVISRRLRKVRDRSEKVGFGRAWKASPRTTGFRATQSHPFQVEVWWRAPADEDPAVAEEAYAAMTDDLKGAGYDVARHPGPGLSEGVLLVTRKREPTEAEWAVLEKVAPHPVDCARDGAADCITADAAGPLVRSGLLDRISYPLVRRHVYDPHAGFMLALSSGGQKLLEARIEHERWLRQARSLGLAVE
ncbi:hypothetical protein P1P68_02545 [Streptomyces scabiei]|uniref:hypothetical protein n=1 Tax=Streptomyces scabiei TaxID=1930 RepID=UPI00298F9046|nr:hypothetical protein [Streptomyces scabiei]MDW8803715.1 hypothetical protein [Streptomyces scabiei]